VVLLSVATPIFAMSVSNSDEIGTSDNVNIFEDSAQRYNPNVGLNEQTIETSNLGT
jgi:hypothetical protein